MSPSLSNFAVIAGVGWCVVMGGLAGLGATDNVKAVLSEPEPVAFQLIDLQFDGSEFYQHHRVTGAESIQANWSAQILRNERVLCSGGGVAPYSGESKKRMTPEVWVGQPCPDLMPGDRAVANWQYMSETGLVKRITGNLIIR